MGHLPLGLKSGVVFWDAVSGTGRFEFSSLNTWYSHVRGINTNPLKGYLRFKFSNTNLCLLD